MKTKTFGSYQYFVSVYYTNKDGEFACHTERWNCAQNAKDMRDLYERNIGKEWIMSADAQGVIDSVFTFKGRQCMFVK